MATAEVGSGSACACSGQKGETLRTDHLYFKDTYMFTCRALVLRATQLDDDQICVVTDKTVMHPQGGGQPADTGSIRTLDNATILKVMHVQKPRNSSVIEHICKSETSVDLTTLAGQTVYMDVDEQRRRLNARLHSGGHLLDAAFVRLRKYDLIPSKGYHFPDGPYVEYIGNIPNEEREDAIRQLNSICQDLIQESLAVQVSANEKGERLVNVGGAECPCGGTHVKNTSEIASLTVTKIKKNKKNIKVSYTISSTA